MMEAATGVMYYEDGVKGTIMVNFICQLGKVTVPDIWSNTSLDVAIKVFLSWN